MSTADTIRAKKNVSENGRLFYPEGVVLSEHYITFLPKKYEYNGSKNGFIEINETDIKSITLPLPKNLSETYNVDWSAEAIGATTSNMADRMGGINSLKDMSDEFGDRDTITQMVKQSLASSGAKLAESKDIGIIAAAISNFFGKSAAGSAATAALVEVITGGLRGSMIGKGLAVNPYLAMLFNGISMRDHPFTFEFFARNQNESKMIRDIINRFKYNMLPGFNKNQFDTGRVLFDYPNIFHIAFMQDDFLFAFKPCVLTNMSVNYHQQGDAFYFDIDGKKAPVSIQLQLQFKEMEIITKDDFNPTAGDFVGAASASTFLVT